MSILLLILKIFGWILLSVLSLILLIICIVLFWHARYEGIFDTKEDITKSEFIFKSVWFFSVFRFVYSFRDGTQECYCKIFGRKKDLLAKDEHTKKRKSSKEVKSKTAKMQTPKKSLKEKLLQLKTELSNQNNKNAFLIMLKELKYLCKHWGPRRFKVNAAFSLGDPADTGILLGVISVFPVAYKRDVVLKSDFESDKMYLLGHAMFKGRIRLIHLVKIIFAVYFKDDSRNLITKFTKK